MKITQLDYSAIMNANSAQMAAESAAQNNRAISMSNAINKMNQANFERTRKLQEDAQAIQASANKTAAIANIINSGLNVGQAGLGLYNSIKQAKYENDLAAYRLANIQNVADFQSLIATTNNLGSFDENGEFKVSEEITGYLDKVVNDIQTSDWTKEVKEQALMQWAEIGASASISIAQEYGTRQRESKATLETLQLEEIKKGEVLMESGYDAGYSFIDGLNYDSTTKEAMKLQYRTSIDSGRRTNKALALLSSNGYKAAYNYVKGLDGITETERNSLFSSISTQYANSSAQTSVATQNHFNELLSSGAYNNPADARNIVNQKYGIDSQDADFRKLINSGLDTVQLEWALTQYAGLQNLEALTPIELDRLYEEIKTDDKLVFKGIESSKQSTLETVDTYRVKYQTAMDTADAKEVKAIEDGYTTKAGTYVSSYKNGTLSSNAAWNLIENESQMALRAFVMNHGQLDEATGSVTWSDPRYEQIYNQLADRLTASNSKYFIDLVVTEVPEPYKDYVSGTITQLLEDHFDEEYKNMSLADQAEWNKLKAEHMDSILRYVKVTATNDMNTRTWDDFIKKQHEELTVETAALYIDLGQKTSLVTQTSDYSENRDVLEKVIEYANDEGEKYVIEYANGGYRIPNPEAQKTFDMTTQQLASDLVARDVITAEESQSYVVSPARDEDGNLTIAPHIVVGSGDQKRAFEYKGATPCEVIDGKLVPVGFPEHQPTSSTGVAPDGFPYGDGGDAYRKMFYTADDWRKGITKDKRDEIDSNQKAMKPYQKRNVTKNSTTVK